MFTTKKTVVTTTRTSGDGKFSKSFDSFMARGEELLDAGSKLMDEAFKGDETSEAVSTTIRIRLTLQQARDLREGKSLTFKADGTTILLESGRDSNV